MEEADFSRVVVSASARQLESDLRELRSAKADLQALEHDIHRRIHLDDGPGKRTLVEVTVWLSKAETLLDAADHLLEDGPQEVSKLLGGDDSNSVFVGRVARYIDDIRWLVSQGDFSHVAAKAVRPRAVRRNQRPTVGNEEMLEEAWSLLHTVEVGIIGIYGMGGVGKTTLLKQINDKFVIYPNDFDMVMWVVVSRDLKPDNIQESIWKQARSIDDRWLQKSFEEKAQDIRDVLQRKKFVLLLDDVWQQFDIQDIGVPLPIQQNGSKVALTTRSLAVCKQMEATQTMKVKPLNQEEAWKLFKEKVGNMNVDVLDVAKKVAEECRGLPIAIITIGRAMASRSRIEEWEHALIVLRRSVSEGMENEIYQGLEVHVFQRLKFSYDCLPNDKVRSCFLYCSLFSEDFEIFTDDLVGYWVAEKFCDLGEGHEIVCTLIEQCLLEEGRKNGREYVKMHDVIRDMALRISGTCEKEKHLKFSYDCLATAASAAAVVMDNEECLILLASLMVEGLSAVFEQLGNDLLGFQMAVFGLLICVAEILYRARTERVSMVWVGNLPFLYSHYPKYKPFGTTVQCFGLLAAVWQCFHASFGYFYARKNSLNPIKMTLTMFLFCLCLILSKIVNKYTRRPLSRAHSA